MKKYFAALLVLLLSAAFAHARVTLKPGPQLWVFSTKGDLASVKQLVKTNPFDKEVLGRALYHTLRRGDAINREDNVAIITLLLSYGADPNFKSLNGQTPLMAAAISNNIDAVRLLLENGADPELSDSKQKKASNYLMPGYQKDVASLLASPPPRNPVRRAKPGNEPKIMNLDLSMEGSDVSMSFDLVASEPVCVRITGSLDKGATYGMSFTGASGDLGENVNPGEGKKILWRSLVDYPQGFSEADALIDVVAEPCR